MNADDGRAEMEGPQMTQDLSRLSGMNAEDGRAGIEGRT
jgi:hypothetical protein